MLLDYASTTPADPALVERTTAALRALLADWYSEDATSAPVSV
jgi:hypothetical protein